MISDHRTQGLDDAIALEQTGPAEGDIDEPQDIAQVQRADPTLVGVELARGIDSADQGTHRGAADGGDAIAPRGQGFDDADMGESAGSSAAECQGNGFAFLPFRRQPLRPPSNRICPVGKRIAKL